MGTGVLISGLGPGGAAHGGGPDDDGLSWLVFWNKNKKILAYNRSFAAEVMVNLLFTHKIILHSTTWTIPEMEKNDNSSKMASFETSDIWVTINARLNTGSIWKICMESN